MNITVKKITAKTFSIISRLKANLTIQNRIKVFGHEKDEISVVYFLNLERQKDRWELFKIIAKSIKLKGDKTLYDYLIRITAIDGKCLELNDVSPEYIKKTFKLSDHYYIDPDPLLLPIIKKEDKTINLTKEEIAIALSHMEIWQKIVNEKIDYALILEDDIYFKKDFSKKVNKIWTELPNNRTDGYKFDILYLSFEEVERGIRKIRYSDHLYKPIKGIWWLSGYVLSFAGAKKLLNERPILGPVDLWLNHIFNKLDVYTADKSIINQRKDYKSNNVYSISHVLNSNSNKN